ncbi:hypothetical protein AB0M44_30990 [Streptosporangium subroseum]|uniref:hypothetical protein n=1 Tax=Streptosporangium subroseum TaxID=106412 RepID=UPI00344AD9D5
MFQATPTRRCQPWCTDHETGNGRPQDGYCRRPAAGTFADIYLSATEDGPMVLAYSVTRDELDLDQAEGYARALLTLVSVARTAVAA